MYTQCPDCSVAFRVTAEVLRQAAGKVRCGGCGIAFNALEHLSELKPQSRVRLEPETPAPELTPELPLDPAEHALPRAISAEQSAALLKTLDQLAGEDIRIEDTGVEWRVLSEDEDRAPDVIDSRDQPLPDEPDPVDFGSMDLESSQPDPADADLPEAEELRFDDDTPLPDDFDLGFDSEPSYSAQPEPAATEIVDMRGDPDRSQVDLVFGEPDEWEDLLGEAVEAGGDEAGEAPGLVEAASEIKAVAENDNVPLAATDEPAELAGDVPPDMDTQFAIQAEALGIDLSGLHETAEKIDVETPAADELSETSIEEDLIAAAFAAEATARLEVSAAEELLDQLEDENNEIEALGVNEEEAGDAAAAEFDDDNIEDEIIEDDDAFELELAADALEDEPPDSEIAIEAPEIDKDDLDAVLALAAEEEDEDFVDEDVVEGADDHVEFESDTSLELNDESAAALEAELAAAFGEEEPAAASNEDVEEEPDEPPQEETFVPPQTEEEMTINMMIDQDLLAIAVEDDDGFTSTIVQKQVSKKDDIPKEKAAASINTETETEVEEIEESKPNPLVETIIMEGETFIGEFDIDKAEEKAKEKANFMAQAREALSQTIHSEHPEKKSGNMGMIAGIVLLLLLLAVQYVHQQREYLATNPLFSSSIGSIYRSIGRPVTPAWDVGGWRIEASKGDATEEENELTIYSRVGNTAKNALPYPLLQVSLTDRFAEIIGSRVLEPAEYLVGGSDPRMTIGPGETFNAIITVQSSAPDATGYNLNICYRLATGQLRCAIEDFK